MRVIENKILASRWHWMALIALTLVALLAAIRRGMVFGAIIMVYALMIFFYSRGYVKQFNGKIGR